MSNTLSNTTTVNSTVNTPVNMAVDVNTFRPYDSQLPVPDLKGYRTVKIIYRENKDTGKKAGETSYIRIPDYITEQAVADRLTDFMPYFVSYLQGQEDELVRSLHKAKATGIAPESLNLDALLEAMASSQTASRLNAERIGEWFKDNMQVALAEAFATKLGIGEEPTEADMEKLLAIVGTYEKKLQSLASPKTAYKKEEAELLQRALEVTGAKDTVVGARFHARLEAMKTRTTDDLLLAL